ncbi:cbb3-type cytochrome c oxidase subunit 3 [Hoeflea sp. AS16]|uniref:cbb3-type cytochrome oxidase subunit 3 n=1 Tax=unclassified Hoeflea TaxID=2614931 RepID=UPI00317E39A7
MSPSHDLMVMIAKSFGLFYLMGFFIIVVIHTYRPSSKALADHAARSVLEQEDQPCRK